MFIPQVGPRISYINRATAGVLSVSDIRFSFCRNYTLVLELVLSTAILPGYRSGSDIGFDFFFLYIPL